MSAGRWLGSCDRSASIWQMTSTRLVDAPRVMPSMYERPSPRSPVRCITSTRPGCCARQRVGHLAGAVRRLIVDDEHARRSACAISCPTSDRQVLALVVGRHDDERASAASRPPALEPQRRDLLGDEADEQDHDAQHDQQHRGVGHVRLRQRWSTRRTPRRRRNAAALIGRKIRSGLKIVITFSRIRKNCDAVGPEPDLRRALRAARPRPARSGRCSPPSGTPASSSSASRSRSAAGAGTRAGTRGGRRGSRT